MESKIEFSIDNESEREKMEKMLRYVSKPFFSMQKIILNDKAEAVIYRRPKAVGAVKCAVKYALLGIEENIMLLSNRTFKHLRPQNLLRL